MCKITLFLKYKCMHLFRFAAAIIFPKLDAVNLSFLIAAQTAFSLCPVVWKAVCITFSGDTISCCLSHVSGSSAWRYSWHMRRSSTTGTGSASTSGSLLRIQCRALKIWHLKMYFIMYKCNMNLRRIKF